MSETKTAKPKTTRSTVRTKKAEASTAITPIEYGGLQAAFDHLNRVLFEGRLPDVFITYQRKAHSKGYFSVDRFSGRVGKFGKHELALNPDAFVDRSDEQIPARWLTKWCTSGSTLSASHHRAATTTRNGQPP
jgi:hypothetical protein